MRRKKKARINGGGIAQALGPEFEFDGAPVPMPMRQQLGPKKVYFPFDEMEVGKSFRTRRVPGTVKTAARRFRKSAPDHAGKRFMVSAINEDGFKTRCWRER